MLKVDVLQTYDQIIPVYLVSLAAFKLSGRISCTMQTSQSIWAPTELSVVFPYNKQHNACKKSQNKDFLSYGITTLAEFCIYTVGTQEETAIKLE